MRSMSRGMSFWTWGYGAKGIGEIATIPTAPAVQNAYRALTGELQCELPLKHSYYAHER